MKGETSTLISLVSFGVATLIGLSQLWKWVQETRDKRKLNREAKTKAEAERDSIAIKGAEGVLLMMQGMLDVSKVSESELRTEIRDLKATLRIKEEVIRRQEDELALLRRTLQID